MSPLSKFYVLVYVLKKNKSREKSFPVKLSITDLGIFVFRDNFF